MKGTLTQDCVTVDATAQGIEQAAAGYFFFFLGIGSEVVAIAVLLYLFKRRGWLGSGPTA